MENNITIELTDFCEHSCKYCSSEPTNIISEATFIKMEQVKVILKDQQFQHIILSGGEPLAHPNFYAIFKLCKAHTEDVIVYSNLIQHRAYNANVIDGVYLEASLTLLPETQKLRILKRVEQGKETHRAEVTFSRNHDGLCDCNNKVIRPDGTISNTPCRKTFKEVR